MCVVEVKGMRGLQTACTCPIADGMEVQTETEPAVSVRKFVLELLFSERNHYCMFCQMSGDCELQDAAYMDGCTNFDFFWRIMLPLVKPALAAVAALVMIVSWNDLLVPLVVLNSNELWTLPLGTMQFQGQYGQDLALVSAFVALSSIPTLIFYLFAEKQIVSGLTAGAIKG